MAKKTAKELSEMISKMLPDSTTDEALSLMEDINDSVTEDTEDWKSKYEENDKSWRERYRNRFMGASDDTDDNDDSDNNDEPPAKLTYDSLFTPVNK